VSAEGLVTGPRWSIQGRQLHFDDRAALLLGGQLHNSSASDAAAIAAGLRHVRELGGNTVIAPVYWDLVEPVEGAFDFSLVGTMLDEADTHDLRLVVLWFGAFKNAASTYAPRWVRADPQRFPRARVEGSIRPAFTYQGATHKPVLSVFSGPLRECDGAALEALMAFIAQHPGRDRIAMVQVENEVGLLADSRDRSALAEATWNGPTPERFLEFLRAAPTGSVAGRLWGDAGSPLGGSWSHVLGEGWEADEVFMAWAFATYVEELAARAAAVWPVPAYANAWLGPQPGQDRAGEYPSGGPGARVLDVWRAAAPTLAMVSPDIYIDDAASVVSAYSFPGNPLFVPECRLRAGDLVLSLAQGAIGWSAFGVDDARPGGQVSQLLAQLTQLEAPLATAQRESRIAGIVLDDGVESIDVAVGGWRIVARGTAELFGRMLLDAGVPHLPASPELPPETKAGARMSAPHDTRPLAIVVMEDDDTFLVLGEGVTLDFFRSDAVVEVDSVVEGHFEDGVWMPGRALNGDERLSLLPNDRIGVVRIRLLALR
jgi:hypothetical protein